MSDDWITIAMTLGGIGLGFGCASVVYVRIFTKNLRLLHEDNVETAELLIKSDSLIAALLVKGDASVAELLYSSDKNRAAEVKTTAGKLADADVNVTRKVEANGGGL